MFNAADVLIHGHPVINLFPVKTGLFRVMGTAEAIKIPGGFNEGIHRVRLPFCRTPAVRAGGIHKGRVPGQRRAAFPRECNIPGENNGKIRFGNRQGSALFAVDDRNGGSPVPLPGNTPVPQSVLDCFLSPAERFQVCGDDIQSFHVFHAVETS